MGLARPFLAVACLIVGVGCSDSAGAGGAGGAGGTSSGGLGGGGAGGSAGAGGGGAGAGGSGGSAGALDGPEADVAGCTFATAAEMLSPPPTFLLVEVKGMTYTPPCLKIRAGTYVTFAGNSTAHPLTGMTNHGTQPNPIVKGTLPAPTFEFKDVGAYGFYCTNHGADAVGPTTGMSGAIYVVP